MKRCLPVNRDPGRRWATAARAASPIAACVALIACTSLTVATVASAQVPAPPVPPSQAGFVKKLSEAYAAKSLALYGDLLADDVTVSVDGQTVATSKAQWLASFGKKLEASGVFFKVPQSYEASGRVLNIEYFNSVDSFPVRNRDCCWSYDAVQYRFSNGKVSQIGILTGGDPRAAP